MTLGVVDSIETVAVMETEFQEQLGLLDVASVIEEEEEALTASDPVSLTDTAIDALQSPREYVETVGLGDTVVVELVGGVEIAPDPVGISDTVEFDLAVEVTDTVGLTEILAVVGDQSVALVENLGLADVVPEPVKTLALLILDLLGSTDTAAPAVDLDLGIIDGLGLTESTIAYLPTGTGFFYMEDLALLYVGAIPVKFLYYGSSLIWTAPA